MIEQSSKQKYYALAIVSMLVTVTIATSQPAYSAASTGIMIPLYTYPGATWDRVIEAKNAHPSVPVVVIINCCNGPGSSQDPGYVAGIQKLHNAGIVVIGYVDTNYASRSTSIVKSEINAWNNFYDIDGIFFDQMSNVSGLESYYSGITQHAKSLGFTFVVGNPGTDTQPSYIGTVDNMIIYESAGLPSLSRLQGWHTSYNKSNFSIIPFGIGSLDTSYVTSASNYVSWIYITNDVLPNPWDSVAPYYMDLTAALDVGTTPTPDPTPTPTSAITVQSADLAGNSITGLWAEITNGGTTVNTGFTPLTYQANSGTQYQVCMADYQNYVFDHWADGSTNSCKTITPTQAVTLTAHYQTGTVLPPPTTPPTITVQSADLAGNSITGLWAEITNGGTTVNTGFTPLTYTAQSGAQYQVCMDDYQNYVFDHWADGSTDRCKTITPTQDVTMTASYKTDVDLVVNSVDLAGNSITGMGAEITNGGTTVKTGFTPLTFAANPGTQYIVCVDNSQSTIFDHWSDGSTDRCKTITPTQATTLTAHYKKTVDITVKSVDLAGSAIPGMWTIYSSGPSLKTGFTPLTFAANPGIQYIVCVDNFQSTVFDHWDDGSTNICRIITPTQSQTLTAFYMR